MLDNNDETQAGAEQASPSLGDMLRSARAAQELTLEQIAAELRIEARALRAIEEHRFDELGAPVFAKGYLKQYANRLNLSYNDLLAEYYRLADPRDVTIEPSRVIKLHDERQITVWIVAVLVLLLLGVSLFVWWINQPEVSFTARAVPPANSAADLERELSLDSAPAAAPSVADQALSPVTLPDANAALAGAASTAPSAPDGNADVAVGLERGAAQAGDPASAAAASVTPTSSGPLLRVIMNFEQDSWAEVLDAQGQRLFYGLGRAGQRSEFAGAPPMDVSLGNADGVRLVVDNEPFAVPSAGRQGNVARFKLDPRD
jgi:cytoskeleton protein RodZ